MLRQKLPPTMPEAEARLTKLGLTAVPSTLSDSDLVVPHHLCATCQNAFSSSRQVKDLVQSNVTSIQSPLKSPKRTNTFQEEFTWVTPRELRSAHLRRCHFCLIALQSLYEDSKYYSSLLWSNFHERPPDLPLSLRISSRSGVCLAVISDRSETKFLKGCAVATLSTADSSLEPVRTASNAQLVVSTESPTMQTLVESWLDSCAGHDLCRSYNNDHPHGREMPHRLLAISQTGETFSVKLWEPSKESVSYVTLSHCWGENAHDFLKLTHDDLARLTAGIPLEELPATFSDAVKTTWRLGKRYIWIDRLCIIQDDRDDWHTEALRMASIYENSAFTIAALGSGPHQSLFSRRDPLPFRPCQILEKGEKRIFAYRRAKVSVTSHYRTHLDDAPLNRRAWVVQERLLTPRVLYLGGSEVVFECRTAACSESWPEGHRPFQFLKSAFAAHNNKVRRCSLDCQERFNVAWHNIVRIYTLSRLSFESDRYIALQGIIASIEQRTGDKSLYGLWDHYLAKELLWESRSSRERSELPNVPSWSWLSRSSVTIDYHRSDSAFAYGKTTFLADVVCHNPPQTGPEGWTSAATYLEFTAPFVEMKQVAPKKISPTWCTFNMETDYSDAFLVLIAKVATDKGKQRDCPLVDQLLAPFNEFSEMGLILMPHQEHEGAFERVGMFNTTYSTGPETWGSSVFDGDLQIQSKMVTIY